MRDFFRGWRRKVGLISLVMACCLMGMWVRSQQMRDSLQVRITDNVAYFFISNESELVWQSMRHEAREFQLKRFAVMQTPVSVYRRNYFCEDVSTTKEDYSHSVSLDAVGGWRGDTQLAAWRIPHWFVVLPLTLLSAYLILWKPRKRAAA